MKRSKTYIPRYMYPFYSFPIPNYFSVFIIIHEITKYGDNQNIENGLIF